jgi:hypothetical protein
LTLFAFGKSFQAISLVKVETVISISVKSIGIILYLGNNLKKLLMNENHSGFNLRTKHSPVARHKPNTW